jgi:hypothetical protein
MRKAWLLLLLAPSALVFACGGDDTGTDGGSDAQADNTVKDGSGGDAANDTSANDTGTDTGPGDAGGDVAISVTCLKPADCIDGGDPDAAYPPDSGVVCCGDIKGNNNAQQCQIVSASTSCTAPGSCATSFTGLVSCSSATVRLCESASECTEQGNNLCCAAQAGDGGTIKICANKQIAGLSGGKIVCP